MKGNSFCKGRKQSAEEIKKRSDSVRGFHHTQEHKDRMSKIMTGRKMLESFGKAVSERMKGRAPWNKGTGKLKIKKVRFLRKEVSILCKNCSLSFLTKEPNKRTYCSVRCSQIYQVGENGAAWIKDRSKLAKRQERNDSAYYSWRKSVRDRDGWKCKMSNRPCLGKVVAHHILPWAKFPELRYEINNGITLCRFHHPMRRDEEMKLSPYFQSLVMNNSN